MYQKYIFFFLISFKNVLDCSNPPSRLRTAVLQHSDIFTQLLNLSTMSTSN